MTSSTILNAALVLHIIGIVMMVGTFFASYFVYRHLWKLFIDEKERCGMLFRIIANFQKAQSVGGALIIVGGIVMVATFHGAPVHLLWFKIKMIFLLLIFLNSGILGRMAVGRVSRIFEAEQTQAQEYYAEIIMVKKKVDLFYALQLVFFLSMFILSVFKFN